MFEVKYNRRKKTEPMSGKFWCEFCDRYLVGVGEKCNVCGNRLKTKHMKK